MVVPCGAKKLAHAAPARELYCSGHFRMILAAAEAEAEACGGEVVILSAKHGLVDLDAVVEPYDLRMGAEGSVGPLTISAQAIVRGWADEDVEVFAFLPAAYFARLDEGLRPLGVWAQDVHEADAGIGEQRHTLTVVRDA